MGNENNKVSENLRKDIWEMKERGMSYSQISKALNIHSGIAHRIYRETKAMKRKGDKYELPR